MLGTLIGVALAGPECVEEIGRERFRTRVIDAQSALDRGELDVTEEALADLFDELPCLSFAPDPRLWADTMLVVAVVAFAKDEDWESPLAAALRIRPAMDRGVGRGHPIYEWPAPAEADKAPLPEGISLVVDGREVDWLPPDQGWYLVQKSDGRYWETRIQKNEPVDRAWLEAPVEQPPRIRFLLDLSMAGAAMSRSQFLGWEADQVEAGIYKPAERRAWIYGPRLAARATFFSDFGVALNGTYMFGFAGGMRDGELMAIATPSRFVLGVGVGLYDVVREVDTLTVDENDEPVRPPIRESIRFWVGSGSYRTAAPIQTEVTLTFGMRTTETWLATVDTRVVFDRETALGGRLRFGGRAGVVNARYVAREDAERTVQVNTLTFSVQLGIVFGDLR